MQPPPPQLDTNLNIYDPNLYGDWNAYVAAKVWWDYKRMALFVIPELFGTLEFKITLHTAEEKDDFFQVASLERSIQTSFKKAYPDKDDWTRMPNSFTPVEINNVHWIKYIKKGDNLNPGYLNYAVPVTSDRYLVVSFYIMKAKDYSDHNWHNAAQADMEKIMNSFNISYTAPQK
ncbi:hypothetical protein ACFL2V_07415 [Pseudomonadota bacterium]